MFQKSSSPTTKTEKKVYPDVPFPSDAKPVQGVNKGLEAHSYKDGKWTQYICKIDLKSKPFAEQIRRELEESSGKKVVMFVKKFLMPDGTSQWWTVVSKPLLEKLHAESSPQPEDGSDNDGPTNVRSDVKTEQVQVACYAVGSVDALISNAKLELSNVRSGNFIKISGKSKDEVEQAILERIVHLKSAKASLLSADEAYTSGKDIE